MSSEYVPGQLRERVRSPLRTAAWFALAFFVGLGGWSAFAPLSGAALAPGHVGIENQRKTIQHLEGGIIDKIAARDGDKVKAGDLLVRLDDTVPRSTYDLLEGQFIDLIVERARLNAEQEGADYIDWPDLLAIISNRERVGEAMRVQQALFDARREALQSRVDILRTGISHIQEQIRGFETQDEAVRRQLELIQKETEAVAQLVEKGLQARSRLYALQRTIAELDGTLGDIASRKAQARVLIGESELEILDLSTRNRNQVVGDLRTLASQIADMQPRLRAARATLDRLDLRAPVSGTVVGLQYHTEGGVIRPGAPVLDLVPEQSKFVIEAKVSPADIDVVSTGLPAEVRLVAFSSRITPTVPGHVTHVSADRLIDQATSQFYYQIKVQLDVDQALLREFDFDLAQLYPGMPVEVMVVTAERTLLDYLLQPVTDMFARAFRET